MAKSHPEHRVKKVAYMVINFKKLFEMHNTVGEKRKRKNTNKKKSQTIHFLHYTSSAVFREHKNVIITFLDCHPHAKLIKYKTGYRKSLTFLALKKTPVLSKENA